jgi:hypothetical protein
MDVVFKAFAYTLSSMFVIGLAGCLIAIPVAAYRLFAVLFEPDKEEDL